MKTLRWLAPAAASLLVASCASHASTPQQAPTVRPSAAAAANALPAWIHALGGASVQLDNATWTIRMSRPAAMHASAGAKGVPAGWRTAKADLTLTNTTDQIQDIPAVSVKARFGAYGRAAAQFTDPQAQVDGLPSGDDAPKVAPGGSFTTSLGLAIPADTPAQDATLTVTVEATLLGQASSLSPVFFEGALPGATAAVVPAVQVQPAKTKTLAFGEWHDDGANRLRLSPITVDKSTVNGQRACSLDLTVINDATDDTLTQSLNTILHVYYGTSLAEGPTVSNDYQGYDDAPIAPQRAATETVHFTLPASAVPGPVTIETGYAPVWDHRVTYEGRVG
ncbi:hypothetical protein ACWGCW_28055 [Streptomyces sp. NPDC054933]